MPLEHRADPYPHWCFTDPASGDQLRLVPERGGLLSGWCCQGRELLYLDAERFADPALSVRGGIPVLFPICGNLPGDRLELGGASYPIAQHGFARDLPWSLAPLPEEGGVLLELCDDARSRAHFPFPFRLQLAYRPGPGCLSITVRIEHLEHRAAPGEAAASALGPMPFSFGLHPYLAVSDPGAVRLEGLPPRCRDQVAAAPADTAALLARLADGVDLLAEGAAAVCLHDPGRGHSLTLQSEDPLDLVVVWSDPPRPMVCLEPWTAPRGALAGGERCLWLPPGESRSLHCRYSLAID